jgi:hypothetical protein
LSELAGWFTCEIGSPPLLQMVRKAARLSVVIKALSITRHSKLDRKGKRGTRHLRAVHRRIHIPQDHLLQTHRDGFLDLDHLALVYAYAHQRPLPTARMSSRRHLDALEEHSGVVSGCGNRPCRADGNMSQIGDLKRAVTVGDVAAVVEEPQAVRRIVHECRVAAAANTSAVAGGVAAAAAKVAVVADDDSTLAEADDFQMEVQQAAVGTE